jgi:predicted RNase H-like HicB family nuclease
MKSNNHIVENRRGFSVSVDVNYFKEGNFVVSSCPALNISSFGKNNKEAKEMFKEALAAFMNDIIDRGKLEVALLELGWQLRKIPTPKYTPPPTKSIRKKTLGGFREKIMMPA